MEAERNQLVSCSIETPVGVMIARASDRGIRAFEFDGRPGDSPGSASNAHLDLFRREIERYFSDPLAPFTVALDPVGTPFQQSVWHALLAIPSGVTRSYSQVARSIGQPTAVRAVAGANGDNPIAIIIPCHRVIGADGSLTGYGGGLERKRWLLEHERSLGAGMLDFAGAGAIA